MTDVLDNLAPALRSVAPSVDATVWGPLLTAAMRAADITTARRVAAFLGQCSEESGGFTALSENLNYSATRMMQVWPSRFPNLAAAAPYANNPEALANNVYGGRLGNAEAGDGWRFRGGGLLQVTGRTNYTVLAAALDMSVEDAAGFVRTPEGAARSAAWVWTWMAINPLADGWLLTAMTQKLNGGLVNLQSRIRLCNAAMTALNTVPFAPAAPVSPPLSPSAVPRPPAPYHTDPAVLARLATLEREVADLLARLGQPSANPDNSSDALNMAELNRIRAINRGVPA